MKFREGKEAVGMGMELGREKDGERGHHVQYVDPDWRWQSSQWS